MKDFPSYFVTPLEKVPNHIFPVLSCIISTTKLLDKPFFTVNCVNDFPSYFETPPVVPIHRFPFRSSIKQVMKLLIKPCRVVNKLKFCGFWSLMWASLAITISGIAAKKGLSMAGTVFGNEKLSCPGVVTLGIPAKTIFGIPAG